MDRAGPAGQQQERDLERILGQMRVGQQVAADAQDHRPVPLDQGGEGRLGRLATTGEVIEQGAIRHRAHRPDAEERADLLAEGGCGMFVRHVSALSLSGLRCDVLSDPNLIEARPVAKGPTFFSIDRRARSTGPG